MKRLYNLLAIAIFISMGGLAGTGFAIGTDCPTWTGIALIIAGLFVGCLIAGVLIAVEKIGDKLLCAALAGALLYSPQRARAQAQPGLALECAALLFIGAAILVPVYLCTKTTPTTTPPPPPGDPPFLPFPPIIGVPMCCTNPATVYDCAGLGYTNQQGDPVTAYFFAGANLDTSTNLIDWQKHYYSVTGWISATLKSTNALYVVYSDGQAISTNQPFPAGDRCRFFRAP